jgi:hypothetical protein
VLTKGSGYRNYFLHWLYAIRDISLTFWFFFFSTVGFIFNLFFLKLSPALWFHNVISEEFGVGVNVFWKHLPSECYDKTDTYGNKDLRAASRATQILDRALKALAELPEEYRDFYARQMVLHIQDKAYSKNFE